MGETKTSIMFQLNIIYVVIVLVVYIIFVMVQWMWRKLMLDYSVSQFVN